MALVEVFIPCYNAEKYIREAIKSVEKQTFSDYEILIIDDGSMDGSVDLIRACMEENPKIHLKHNDGNRGVGYTRNRAIRECKAKYIAFLDADDTMPCNRLQVEVDYLEKHDECDMVFGGYQRMLEDGQLSNTVLFGELESYAVNIAMLFYNVIALGSGMIRKTFLLTREVLFDEQFLSLGDYNFWVDCILSGANIHVLNQLMQFYRANPVGLSAVHSSSDKIKQRNKNFDMIHEKMLNYWKINLAESEKRVFLEYTNDEPKSRAKKIKDFPVFMKMIHKLKKQDSLYREEFLEELRKFRKRCYYFFSK